MTDENHPGKRPIPARQIRAAAIGAGILGAVVTVPLVVKGITDGENSASYYKFALLVGAGIALTLWPLILFALSLMHARIDAHKRGSDTPP